MSRVTAALRDFLQEQNPLKTLLRKVLVNTVGNRPEHWVLRKYIKGLTLNVGSGSDRIPNTVSIDIDPSKAEIGMALDIRNLDTVFRENSVDCIVAMHVLEHIDRTEDFISVAHKILKPHGTLCLILPDFEAQGSVGYYRTIDHVQEMVRGKVWVQFRRDARWNVLQFNKLSFWFFYSFDIVLEKR